MATGQPIPKRGHLLLLPNEVLDMTCQYLDEGSLVATRLTCRALRIIPERCLFTTIRLDRLSSSMINLMLISQHERIRHHIKEVQMELQRPFFSMDRDQWMRHMYSYKGRARLVRPPESIVDLKSGWNDVAPLRDRLAKVRDAMSTAERREAKERFQKYLAEQRELENWPWQSLHHMFAVAFTELPNIQSFTCSAMTFSKYVTNPRHDSLRRLQRETLLYPIVRKHWDSAERRFIGRYVLLCLSLLLVTSGRVRSIKMETVPWEMFEGLESHWPLPQMLRRMAGVETLIVHPFVHGGIRPVAGMRRAGTVISRVLSTAPRMVEFTWSYKLRHDILKPDRSEYFDLVLPPLRGFSTGALLQKIDLAGIECGFNELRQFFRALSGSLKSLSLAQMRLADGFWSDTFQYLHNNLSLSSLKLRGELWDSFQYDDCWVISPDPQDSSELGVWWLTRQSNTSKRPLLCAVCDYVTHASNERPLKTSGEQDPWSDWTASSDRSMLYFVGG
jgi:hypothetical protein